MSKSRHAKPDEFQKEQIRHLRKELKKANQTIRSLEKDLGYNQNKSSKSERREKEIDLDLCNSCGKGIIKVSDLGIRKITTCTLCSYRKITK